MTPLGISHRYGPVVTAAVVDRVGPRRPRRQRRPGRRRQPGRTRRSRRTGRDGLQRHRLSRASRPGPLPARRCSQPLNHQSSARNLFRGSGLRGRCTVPPGLLLIFRLAGLAVRRVPGREEPRCVNPTAAVPCSLARRAHEVELTQPRLRLAGGAGSFCNECLVLRKNGQSLSHLLSELFRFISACDRHAAGGAISIGALLSAAHSPESVSSMPPSIANANWRP